MFGVELNWDYLNQLQIIRITRDIPVGKDEAKLVNGIVSYRIAAKMHHLDRDFMNWKYQWIKMCKKPE